MGVELAQHRLAGERHTAGQQVIKRAAQRVDVAAHIGGVRILGLFGRDVIRRAEDDVLPRQSAFSFARIGKDRQAEIEDLHRAVGGAHEIVRLQIAMDQAARKGMLKTDGRLAHDVARRGHRQRTVLAQLVGEVDALDVLHRQQMRIAGLFGVEGGNDIRMAQARGGLSLTAEAVGGAGPGDELRPDRLDRDLPSHHAMFDQPHGAHAPVAEQPHRQVARMVHQRRRSFEETLVSCLRPGSGRRTLATAWLDVGRRGDRPRRLRQGARRLE